MRKHTFLISSLMLFLLFSACDNIPAKSEENKGDTTVYDETRLGGNNYLEDLLNVKSEADLIAKFGADHVKYDTIWGAEGNFGFGTFLDKGSKDEVQLFWKDSLRTQGITSAVAVAFYEPSGNYNFENKWSSEKGVKIGMTTSELEKMNGVPFIFSGFGWDYGGGILDWKGGKLDVEGFGIQLTEGEGANNLPEMESNQIIGDRDVSSDNPVVKKVQPKVSRISVYKPG